MWEYLVEQFNQNQFLQAAVVGAPLTVLTYTAREIPGRIYHSLKRFFTIEVNFKSDIPEFKQISKFVTDKIVMPQFSRRYTFEADSIWDDANDKRSTTNETMAVGYGNHVGRYKRKWCFISRSLEESNATREFKERIEIRVLTRNRTIVKDLFNEITESIKNNNTDSSVPIFVSSGSWWQPSTRLPRRSLDTVFIPDSVKERFINHIVRFQDSEEYYHKRGLPWHTGIMLTGQPGTGKTSLIHALASELGRSIRYLSLASVTSDQQLTELISNAKNWEDTILVIEDADASGANVNTRVPSNNGDEEVSDPQNKPLSMSAILNVLDGLLTPNGMLVIATSNHPETIDGAFLRPGRFDLSVEIGAMALTEFRKMVDVIGPDDADLLDDECEWFIPTPGSTLRSILLEKGVCGVMQLMADKKHV